MRRSIFEFNPGYGGNRDYVYYFVDPELGYGMFFEKEEEQNNPLNLEIGD